MDESGRLRVRESPIGGSRIAFSYLGTVIALMIALLLAAVTNPAGSLVCAADAVECQLGWVLASSAGGFLVALGVPAWALRLGWEWWAVFAGALVSLPLWVDAAPPWVSVPLALALPALAGLATGPAAVRPRWRPWVIGAIAVILALAGVLSVVL